MLCAKFVWNWLSGSGEDKNVKSLWQQQRRQQRQPWQTMDIFWSEKLTWAFSSGELIKDIIYDNYKYMYIILLSSPFVMVGPRFKQTNNKVIRCLMLSLVEISLVDLGKIILWSKKLTWDYRCGELKSQYMMLKESR